MKQKKGEKKKGAKRSDGTSDHRERRKNMSIKNEKRKE